MFGIVAIMNSNGKIGGIVQQNNYNNYTGTMVN